MSHYLHAPDVSLVAKKTNLMSIINVEAQESIDIELDNEYNAVVDSIYVQTFYIQEEN